MKFKKQFMQDLVSEDLPKEEAEIISNELCDNSRWSVIYDMIFKVDGKFYKTSYRRGATECQDERPYEYSEDEIECKEVFPKQKTITVYE
jgi:hypothetical protein